MASTAIPIEIDTISASAEKPSKTYALTLDTKRFEAVYSSGDKVIYHGRIIGYTDGQEAVKQAIRKALITPRFKCLIYNNQYGSEIEAAITADDASREYIKAAVPNFVEDCLKPDSRILSISDFNFEFKDDCAYIEFTADTIFGKIDIKESV